MYTHVSTKTMPEIGPCAYRNWKSDSDCYMLHGYCRTFHFVFGSENLDRAGFVVDFGDLDLVKSQLETWFDHTVILQADDPLVPTFQKLTDEGNCNLKTFPLISCEGLAQYVGTFAAEFITDRTKGRATVVSCEVRETGKNSAIYNYSGDVDKLSFADLEAYNKQLVAANTGS